MEDVNADKELTFLYSPPLLLQVQFCVDRLLGCLPAYREAARRGEAVRPSALQVCQRPVSGPRLMFRGILQFRGLLIPEPAALSSHVTLGLAGGGVAGDVR